MNKKWIDVRIGEYTFTVRCTRTSDSTFGNVFDIEIFPLHKHPITFWERFTEILKYYTFDSCSYYEALAEMTLSDWVVDCCKDVAERIDKKKNIENQWENL